MAQIDIMELFKRENNEFLTIPEICEKLKLGESSIRTSIKRLLYWNRLMKIRNPNVHYGYYYRLSEEAIKDG